MLSWTAATRMASGVDIPLNNRMGRFINKIADLPFETRSDTLTNSRLAGLYDDAASLNGRTLDELSMDANPDAVRKWVSERIFGNPAVDSRFPTTNALLREQGHAQARAWTRNNNLLYKTGAHMGRNVGKYSALTAGILALAPADTAAGYLYGGPGYGGFIGFGEGVHSERNAMSGALTNMNYQAQMMGLQELNSNQVAPQYSLSVAPMRQRRASTALRDSTNGLTLGLHKGRHGGY